MRLVLALLASLAAFGCGAAAPDWLIPSAMIGLCNGYDSEIVVSTDDSPTLSLPAHDCRWISVTPGWHRSVFTTTDRIRFLCARRVDVGRDEIVVRTCP